MTAIIILTVAAFIAGAAVSGWISNRHARADLNTMIGTLRELRDNLAAGRERQ